MIWYDFSDGVDGTVILLVGGQKHFPRHVLFPPPRTKAICFVQDIPKIECVTYSPDSERENETRCIEKETNKGKKEIYVVLPIIAILCVTQIPTRLKYSKIE